MKLTKNEWLHTSRWIGQCLIAMGLLGMALAVASRVQAVSTTTVQGTVYLAKGRAGAGTLDVSWPALTTANSLAITAGRETVSIGADGFVSLNLAPSLGANAQNNTIAGLRNEGSTNQVVADAGSAYNNWMTGGTMFTEQLTDNGTHNSFMDPFHCCFNGMKGDWYGSQQNATVTNHYRLGIAPGNEHGLLNRDQTDYGFSWTTGLSHTTAAEQYYQVLDELNNVYRLSIEKYHNGQSSTNNQTVINAARTGAILLNGSSNAGTGGEVFGSGGANVAVVATINNAENAQFKGTLQVGGTLILSSSATLKNQADAEIDATLWTNLTASQKESFTYRGWNGNSQWYMVKDANNNRAMNSAVEGLDSFKAYQSTNSGDTYVNTANSSGVIRLNNETGSSGRTCIYGGGSGSLITAFSGTTSIAFSGLAASSGCNCLQIYNSGYITNTGSACGTSTDSTNGTVSSGNAGQIAYYASNGSAISGTRSVPVTAGGTGATTAAGALASMGAQAAIPGMTGDGKSTPGIQVAGTVAAAASAVGKVIQLPGGVQTAGTFASYLAHYGSNTTYVLPPSYSETITSTIALSQNNVNIQCGTGATLLNGTSVPPSPILLITGTHDTIGAGCTFNNQNVYITSIYDGGSITLVGSTNTILNGVNVINCGTAYEASPCVSAVDINGAQFDQMNLAGPYGLFLVARGNATSQNFEVVGGTMGTLGIAVLGPNGIIQNYRVSGTNLNAIGGDAVCGGIGVYSGPGQTGSILNGTVTGTTCTISGTASATVRNVAISGSGSMGTITLTLSSSTPFWPMENVIMSGFGTYTCLNGKDLRVTSTSGLSVSFSTNGTTCTTGSEADHGNALAAAFGGWSNPSAGQNGFTFSNNVIQFAEGTSQYVQYAGYEMGCVNCTVSDNVFNMPDAHAQTYGCIISYSANAQVAGNLCNGFGVNGVGIGLAGGISTVRLPNSDHVKLINNTIINTAANLASYNSKGMSYGCHYAGTSANHGEISGNHIYGTFSRGMEIGDSSTGGCSVEFTAHDNHIFNATTGFYIYKATGSISNTFFSGVTTPTNCPTLLQKHRHPTRPKRCYPARWE